MGSEFIDKSDHGRNWIIQIDDEVATLIEEINASPQGAQIDFAENLKNVVVDSIMGPFGLSAAMFADKDGGNITTQHNANQGIFAKESEGFNREKDYDYTPGKTEIKNAAVQNGSMNSETFIDQYTGKQEPSKRWENGKLKANFEADHLYPVSDLHREGGWMLTPEERKKLSSTTENLYLTTHENNRKKSNKLPDEALSPENGFDPSLIDPKKEAARKALDEQLPGTMDRVIYQGREFVIEGGKEAGKLALRQVLGLILKELSTGLIDDIRQVIRDGFQSLEHLVSMLRARMEATAEKIKEKWKDFLIEGAAAGLAGILSSLVTLLINSFITTAKRIVTIIREGILAIAKSIKLIISPPEGMTGTEIAVEVLKLLSGGLVIAATLSLQEAVAKMIEGVPPFAPYAQDIATVLVGVLSGTLGLLAVLAFDRLKSYIRFQNKQLADVHRGQAVSFLKIKQTLGMLDGAYTFAQESTSYMQLQLTGSWAVIDESSQAADVAVSEFGSAVKKLRELAGRS